MPASVKHGVVVVVDDVAVVVDIVVCVRQLNPYGWLWHRRSGHQLLLPVGQARPWTLIRVSLLQTKYSSLHFVNIVSIL